MIALLDNGQDLESCEAEIGARVGQLLTPLTRYRLRDATRPWAIDNGAFAGFKPDAFMSLLEREDHHKEKCLFVTSPDIVGSAQRTLELFALWAPRMTGWPLALVCQDGQESLPIPWGQLAAVFIGGSTNWKVSQHVTNIIATAKHFGAWVHVGRVNDPARWEHFDKLGVDSADGTGIARYSHMREAIAKRDAQEKLFASQA